MQVADFAKKVPLILWQIVLVFSLAQCAMGVLQEQAPLGDSSPPSNTSSATHTDDRLELARRIMRQHPNGTATLLYSAQSGETIGSHSSYRLEAARPFSGQFWLLNAYQDQPHTFAVSCLLDYVQLPCAFDQPASHIRSLGPMEELLLPLEIPVSQEGVHDLVILSVKDAFGDWDDENAYSRTVNEPKSSRVNLLVGGISTPPVPPIEKAAALPAIGRLSRGFLVSPLAQPFQEQARTIVWTHDTVQANELFDFYVHLANPLSDPVDLAVLAFIDYKQVPIYRQGEPRTPLYVESEAGVWQPLSVQVRAPSKPGIYEFVVVAMAEPFSLMEAESNSPVIASTRSSARIRLEVTTTQATHRPGQTVMSPIIARVLRSVQDLVRRISSPITIGCICTTMAVPA